MGQLLLVRHGQASWGAEDYDVLSPLGWEQGRLLGAALAGRGVVPDLVVQGSLRRHRETAEALVEAAGWSGVPLVEESGWDEFDHLAMLDRYPSPFEGREPTRAEFQQWFVAATDRWTSGSHDDEYAEPFPVFADRVEEALVRAIDRVGSGRTALVVTSGGPVALVAASLLAEGDDASRGRLWCRLNRVVVNSSLTKVVVGRNAATLVSFNEHSHLEGDGLTYR